MTVCELMKILQVTNYKYEDCSNAIMFYEKCFELEDDDYSMIPWIDIDCLFIACCGCDANVYMKEKYAKAKVVRIFALKGEPVKVVIEPYEVDE